MDEENINWRIEYDNDVGAFDGYFVEWWNVTDGDKSFKCDYEEDADWLLSTLTEKEKTND